MSYNRGPRNSYGGGGQRRYYDGDAGKGSGPQRKEVYMPETPEQKIRNAIYNVGDQPDFDASTTLPRLADLLLSERTTGEASVQAAIGDAIHIGTVEQPYKTSTYAGLVALLVQPDRNVKAEPATANGDAPPTDASGIGRGILDDAVKGFQASLDRLRWREIRLMIHLFAYLTLADIISRASLLQLLRTFTAVLDEFGVSHSRGIQAALCAGEGVLIAGRVLCQESSEEVESIIIALETFSSTASSARRLLSPILLHYDSTEIRNVPIYDMLESLIATLRASASDSFSLVESPFLQHYALFPSKREGPESLYILPTYIVPPEVIEIGDGVGFAGSGEDRAATLSPTRDFPEVYMRLFDDEVTPSTTHAAGYLLRTLVMDTVSVFEVNRREGARLLTEISKWCRSGVFHSQASSEGAALDFDWQLEPLIVETIISSFCVMPRAAHPPVYYYSLLTEVCKLSPTTFGPAVGKSIRKMYSWVGEGLSVVVTRRFAEWFSVHMSNFGFTWVWKEWIPDLELPLFHPKLRFMRLAIELQIRLSYYDRIMQALPPQIRDPEAGVVPAEAPAPLFQYGSDENQYRDDARVLGKLMQGNPEERRPRASPDEVIAEVNRVKERLVQEGSSAGEADRLVRSIAFQSLLNLGSRSFSHLLNALERYLPLLRTISTSHEAKQQLLDEAERFWTQNPRMILIVFDKLMQYQIVEALDVINWALRGKPTNGTDESMNGQSSGAAWLTVLRWEVMTAAVDKANGRVALARKRVATLRREDDEARAKLVVNVEDDAMDGKDPTRLPTPPSATDSPALASALKGLATLTRDQRNVLSAALTGLVQLLLGSPELAPWESRSDWNETDWACWETWGWFRQFCFTYSFYLRSYMNTLGTAVLSNLTVPAGCNPSSPELIKATWNVALAREEES